MRKGGDGAGGTVATPGVLVGWSVACGRTAAGSVAAGGSVRSTMPSGRSQQANFSAGARTGGSAGTSGLHRQSEHVGQAAARQVGGAGRSPQHVPPVTAQHQSGGRATSAAQARARMGRGVAITNQGTVRGRPRSIGNRPVTRRPEGQLEGRDDQHGGEFVLHCHVRLGPDVVSEPSLHHRERGFDVRRQRDRGGRQLRLTAGPPGRLPGQPADVPARVA